MGGFEGADHINGDGLPLDMVQASGHLDRLDEDHRRAAQAGLRCVRESIGWRLSEGPAGGGGQGGPINLDRALRIQASARRHGLQVLWTLMHYGLPGDLSLHNDALVPRLARFAAEVARVLGSGEWRPPVYTPINEIGFLAWAASQPGWFHPPNNVPDDGSEQARALSHASGWLVKQRLARAALAAMQALRAGDPRARFMHVEPLVHVVAPLDRPDLASQAAEMRSWQWQACDMIAGRLLPELGGAPEWLDLVGVNHYHNSQWEMHSGRQLDWFERDPRRLPFNQLLAETWQRYGRPLVVAETSHVGCGRAEWLHDIASEVRQARSDGVPVLGLCLYPLIDRPDWHEPQRWHRSGVWHVQGPQPAALAQPAQAGEHTDPLARHDEPAVLAALCAWQTVLPQRLGCRRTAASQPVLLAFSQHCWAEPHRRSRQLLQGLADAGWRLVCVQPPITSPGPARLDVVSAGPSVQVLTPWLPAPVRAAQGLQQSVLQDLLKAWLAEQRIAAPTVWLDAAAAWPLARKLGPLRVVYDSAAAGHDGNVDSGDADLLHHADLVLTSTLDWPPARLRQAGDRLRVVADGADLHHFASRRGVGHDRGCNGGWADDEARQLLGRAAGAHAGPWLGFAGDMGGQVDLPLLALLAATRPQWHFALVGPLCGLDAPALPRAPNLHWLGPQPHALLPALMARWQAVLLPFKPGLAAAPGCKSLVLHALAAGLPVLGTPAAEQSSRGLQRSGVYTAEDVAGLLALAERVLAETAGQQRARHDAARAFTQRASWQRAVNRVVQHLLALRGPTRARLALLQDGSLPQLSGPADVRPVAANERPVGLRSRA